MEKEPTQYIEAEELTPSRFEADYLEYQSDFAFEEADDPRTFYEKQVLVPDYLRPEEGDEIYDLNKILAINALRDEVEYPNPEVLKALEAPEDDSNELIKKDFEEKIFADKRFDPRVERSSWQAKDHAILSFETIFSYYSQLGSYYYSKYNGLLKNGETRPEVSPIFKEAKDYLLAYAQGVRQNLDKSVYQDPKTGKDLSFDQMIVNSFQAKTDWFGEDFKYTIRKKDQQALESCLKEFKTREPSLDDKGYLYWPGGGLSEERNTYLKVLKKIANQAYKDNK